MALSFGDHKVDPATSSFQFPNTLLVERAALITDKGLLVMPTSGKISVMQTSNGVINFTPTGNDYTASTTSSRFDIAGGFLMSGGNLSYKTYDGEVFRVYATIHTHPNTSIGNPQLPSTSDRGDYMCAAYGIEQYILGAEGITERGFWFKFFIIPFSNRINNVVRIPRNGFR